MTRPSVSIVTAVYNGMPYLAETVKSVLGQSYPHFEYLLIDDGSTDETSRYLKTLSDPRVRVIRQENQGVAAARNEALKSAQGDWIANLDADDIAHPNRIELQLDAIEKDQSLVMLGSAARRIDSHGELLSLWKCPTTDPAIRFQMLFGCPFIHPTVLYDRKLALQCGGFQSKYDSTEDYDFAARISQFGNVANIDEPLIDYRVHEQSLTGRLAEKQSANSLEIICLYAAQSGIRIQPNELKSLFQFLESGRTTNPVSIRNLNECYTLIREHFAALDAKDPNLRACRQEIQKRLRWWCTQQLANKDLSLLQRLQFIGSARKFDPEQSTLPKFAWRLANKAHRSIKSKTTTA